MVSISSIVVTLSSLCVSYIPLPQSRPRYVKKILERGLLDLSNVCDMKQELDDHKSINMCLKMLREVTSWEWSSCVRYSHLVLVFHQLLPIVTH